jgi:branched-chain amino acid transport system substrate-binding protein
MKHRHPLLVTLAILIVLVGAAFAACGGDDETTTTAAAPADTSAPVDTASPDTTAATTAEPTGDPIVIGAVVSATGPTSPLGEPERATLMMMEKKVNAEGGLLGRPIKIVIEDDKSTPEEAVKAANKLIQQDKVVALLGSSGSPATLAIKPITEKAGLPHIALAAANKITEAPIPWIWRAPPRDALAVGKALEYISGTMKLTKIGLLHDENAYGSSGAAEIKAKVADYGLEVVATESYKTEDTDLTAQLTKIKGANPDVIVVWGTNPGPAVAAKNMKQLGMAQPFVGSHGIANAKFIELAADAAEGVIFPAGRLLVPESFTDPAQKAIVDAFVAAYKAETGQAPPTFAGHAFGGLLLLMDAINRAGSTEAAAIQAALNSTSNLPTPDGIYNFTETDHDGLKIEDLTVVKIEGGKWVLAE